MMATPSLLVKNVVQVQMRKMWEFFVLMNGYKLDFFLNGIVLHAYLLWQNKMFPCVLITDKSNHLNLLWKSTRIRGGTVPPLLQPDCCITPKYEKAFTKRHFALEDLLNVKRFLLLKHHWMS